MLNQPNEIDRLMSIIWEPDNPANCPACHGEGFWITKTGAEVLCQCPQGKVHAEEQQAESGRYPYGPTR